MADIKMGFELKQCDKCERTERGERWENGLLVAVLIAFTFVLICVGVGMLVQSYDTIRDWRKEETKPIPVTLTEAKDHWTDPGFSQEIGPPLIVHPCGTPGCLVLHADTDKSGGDK